MAIIKGSDTYRSAIEDFRLNPTPANAKRIIFSGYGEYGLSDDLKNLPVFQTALRNAGFGGATGGTATLPTQPPPPTPVKTSTPTAGFVVDTAATFSRPGADGKNISVHLVRDPVTKKEIGWVPVMVGGRKMSDADLRLAAQTKYGAPNTIAAATVTTACGQTTPGVAAGGMNRGMGGEAGSTAVTVPGQPRGTTLPPNVSTTPGGPTPGSFLPVAGTGPTTPPAGPPPVDPMQKLRDAMAEARKMIPKRGELEADARTGVDLLANQARATLQQDVARKGSEDQKALARQLASRGRIGGPASEALKGQLTSQLNASLTQGLSQVETTRLQEINRVVGQEMDRATSFADRQFTAAAGLIAMGANSDEVIKQMGVAFQNDLSKIASQNRFVAEQAATDRTFRMQLQQMGQDFEKMMAQFKLDEASKQQNLGFLGSIFSTIGSIASFALNPIGALSGGDQVRIPIRVQTNRSFGGE